MNTSYGIPAPMKHFRPCRSCKGEGHGRFLSGAAWVCSSCDGTGKEPVFPPRPDPMTPYRSNMNENGWTP
jgi:ribosomal protein L37AE/L43A